MKFKKFDPLEYTSNVVFAAVTAGVATYMLSQYDQYTRTSFYIQT